ncbi:phospholipase A2 inhibitor and Ly6/PLAUR domain-containing protein-like [Sphaerodactylus townsendi]|uniref:phospholipase A2 inhibitor and Ly6/PLAUR domain-containing protein-like n=1 Tax=Sphaerodactylus townsendi TaxID=933632 RepID=UPI0020275583|nr:phospholipase A2 inhibitor and Ly6/PLAUR domain-containing protein-like [Sphaerodactylus townsendi]
MPGFVLFCLLSAFLTSGNSLVCEVCKSKEASCSGTLQTCEDSEHVCSTMVAEYRIGGIMFTRSFKECMETSPICDFIPFSMTFRPSIAMRTTFNCCSTDGCNSVQPELPEVSRTPNGFECPSCFALGASRCGYMDTLQCSGNEDHCFEITGTLMIGNFNFTKSSAGCGTAGTCSKKVGSHRYSKNVVDVLTKVKCSPALQAGSTRTEL